MKSPHERRNAPMDMDPDQFREVGYTLVDRIAEHLERIRDRPVTRAESPNEIRNLLSKISELPEDPTPASELLDAVTRDLFDHSLSNGHPRFWGYITSSPAPIGMLGDFLASAVNSNVGAWKLSPLATEIEAETIRWIARFIGYPDSCGGLLVSGGNMANFVCFLAARREKAGEAIRRGGLAAHTGGRLRVYASSETHTWIQKAADLFGHGTDAIGWIPANRGGQLDVERLRRQVEADQANGDEPFLVVGNAGTVGTGAADPLAEIGVFCRESGIWFHVDGAYGALAARVAGAPPELAGLEGADSVAVDPHKWLYAPLEAGCALVRHVDHLRHAFSYHPPYYRFDENVLNYFDLGMQNSRGFRALKVWLALRQAGARAYRKTIGEDIRLAGHLFALLDEDPEFEALSQNLSITTFRYVPRDLPWPEGADRERYLDSLNQQILDRLASGGEAFLSNAIVNGRFGLRLCIVNFRTLVTDIEFLPELVRRLGRECDHASR